MPKPTNATTATKTKKTTTSTPVTETVTLTSVPTPTKTVEVAPTPAPAPVVTVTSVSTTEQVVTLAPVDTTEESNTELLFNKLINQFQDIQSVMKTLHSNLKVLQKEVLQERKDSKKKEVKHKKKSDKKKSPSGFAKPSSVSAELATFLGIAPSEQIARTEVTSKVIAYIKEHNLQNPERKKEIIPDEKLSMILQAGPTDIIQFFNLQTYLKKHFISNTVDTTTTTTVAPTVV
jgi:chromatin remodeling complex protein RSC6